MTNERVPERSRKDHSPREGADRGARRGHSGKAGKRRPEDRGGDRRRGGRGRASRGDVRAAVLLLVSDEPMHGYQLMQAMAERTDGAWRPSSGVVYPAIKQLEADGLVEVSVESGRRSVSLTPSGRQHVEDLRGSGHDPFAAFLAAGPDLRDQLDRLHSAAREIGRHGTPEQRGEAEKILDDARRALYRLLADDGEPA